MTDINQTDWSPNRKIVAQSFAFLMLTVTGAVLTFYNVELDIPLGIETALAVVLGYFIRNRTRTETTVERIEETKVVETEKPD